MTRQEIFNTMYLGVLKQGKPGGELRVVKGSDGVLFFRCCYRASDGCKCNVGQLIPDDKYDPNMEIKSAVGLLEVLPAIDDTIAVKTFHFYEDLQAVHDRAAAFAYNCKIDFIPEYKLRMADYAKKNGLEVPSVGEVS